MWTRRTAARGSRPALTRGGTLDHWATPIGLKCLESAEDAVAVPARAGDAIVFSSLSPHRTGPNLKTGTVRKAYILQYSHDGSIATLRDGPRRAFRYAGGRAPCVGALPSPRRPRLTTRRFVPPQIDRARPEKVRGR